MGGMMTMKGPHARLAKIGAFIAAAPERLPDRVSREVERAVLPLIKAGFATSSDPYGKAWAQPKAGNKPLVRTGKGKRSYEVIRLVSGGRWVIVVSNNARSRGGRYYMGILQAGFRHRGGSFVAARKQVPEGQNVGRWKEPLTVAGIRGGAEWAKAAP